MWAPSGDREFTLGCSGMAGPGSTEPPRDGWSGWRNTATPDRAVSVWGGIPALP